MLMAGDFGATAQTISDINKATGLREALVAARAEFTNAVDIVLPKPLPEAFEDAWTTASETAFDPDTMLAAIEANMAGKLSPAELGELAAFFASSLGQRVTEIDLAAIRSPRSEQDTLAGKRIVEDLASTDPARLAVFRKIIDDLNMVDNLEAITLNFFYALVAGMNAAEGQSLPDDAMAAAARMLSADVRENAEDRVLASSAFDYRELQFTELEDYAHFLASPAGGRYYDLAFHALGTVLADEARAFGNRLFVALGYRKA